MSPAILVLIGIAGVIAGSIWANRQKHMSGLVEPLVLMAGGVVAFAVGVIWLIVQAVM